jgi:hypothetical protein
MTSKKRGETHAAYHSYPGLEEKLFMLDVYEKLAEGEADITAGRTENAKENKERRA